MDEFTEGDPAFSVLTVSGESGTSCFYESPLLFSVCGSGEVVLSFISASLLPLVLSGSLGSV